jgi:hypothetical protein
MAIALRDAEEFSFICSPAEPKLRTTLAIALSSPQRALKTAAFKIPDGF